MNQTPFGLAMSDVGQIEIGDPNRRITQQEKDIVITAVQTALSSISGVMSSTINIQINQLIQQYLESIGYQKMLTKFQHAGDELSPLTVRKQARDEKASEERSKKLTKLQVDYEAARAKIERECVEKLTESQSQHSKESTSAVKRRDEISSAYFEFLAKNGISVTNGTPTIIPTAKSTPDAITLAQTINDLRNSAGNVAFSKLNMRIALATTVGEVAKIVRAALGNGVLPDVKFLPSAGKTADAVIES